MSKTTIPTNKTKGLSNPAVVAAASSPAGQRAIAAQAEAGAKIAVFLVKTVVILGIIGTVYYMYTSRFKKQGYNKNLPDANVSDAQALARADALYNSMYGYGANFDEAANALQGLNYNGWIKVYNAFGNREDFLGYENNLVDWLTDQFSGSELENLRSLVNNVF